ncbi:hypothetical protein [Microbulbifer zhoushanensis]|uniref:hypothetical protein n=1 Tax=Microbulbifer zhoushanensis TaxID=2904254 RepID=UPI001F274C6B|nr:hypothetical protein [Microbulbifer zhoushanensis]
MKYVLTLLLALSLWGCGSPATAPAAPDRAAAAVTAAPLQRAMVAPSLVYRAIEVQQQLDAREGELLAAGAPWFRVVPGRIPVVITAPHATRPLRNGKRRFSDGGGTAALALALAELTGAHVVYTTEEGPSDPNYHDDNAFKRALAGLVRKLQPRYVLDIHGSHAFRPYDIDLGTMHGESLLGQGHLQQGLVTSLRNEGILNISGNYFAAAKNQTITKFVAALGVPAIQVEVNTTYLSPSAGKIEAQRFSQLAQAMARFIESGWERPRG